MSETKIGSELAHISATPATDTEIVHLATHCYPDPAELKLLARLRDEIARRERAEENAKTLNSSDIRRLRERAEKAEATLEDSREWGEGWKERAEKAEAELAQARASLAMLHGRAEDLKIPREGRSSWMIDSFFAPSAARPTPDLIAAYRRVIRDLAAQSGD